MWKYIQAIGITGFFLCLSIMYMTNLGVRGIRKLDPMFQSPDMKFHYSVDTITKSFGQIGDAGRVIYQKYLLLDCIFTLCFLIVMITITNLQFKGTTLCYFVMSICVLRGVFDLLENLFLFVILKNYPIIKTPMITSCSYFTSIKFLMLFFWMAVLIIQTILVAVKK